MKSSGSEMTGEATVKKLSRTFGRQKINEHIYETDSIGYI